MSQPFPSLQSKIIDANGNVTPIWRAFFQSLWNQTGKGIGAVFAALAGNTNQTFDVATAVQPTNAVPKQQADATYAPIKGSLNYAPAGGSSAAFNVGTAVLSTNATPLAQVKTLITQTAGAAIMPITVGASPFAYTAPNTGSVVVSGGSVSSISLTRNVLIATGVTAGILSVKAGDVLTVTYSALPTMNLLPA
ncbi:MAG TPA: hypothetical protein PLI96_07980 [Halothiobacillus sp.]|nr:hypothetical protein [Halothiobacillus sp.]